MVMKVEVPSRRKRKGGDVLAINLNLINYSKFILLGTCLFVYAFHTTLENFKKIINKNIFSELEASPLLFLKLEIFW